jgi:hypothetical protein
MASHGLPETDSRVRRPAATGGRGAHPGAPYAGGPGVFTNRLPAGAERVAALYRRPGPVPLSDRRPRPELEAALAGVECLLEAKDLGVSYAPNVALGETGWPLAEMAMRFVDRAATTLVAAASPPGFGVTAGNALRSSLAARSRRGRGPFEVEAAGDLGTLAWSCVGASAPAADLAGTRLLLEEAFALAWGARFDATVSRAAEVDEAARLLAGALSAVLRLAVGAALDDLRGEGMPAPGAPPGVAPGWLAESNLDRSFVDWVLKNAAVLARDPNLGRGSPGR